jgi:hypothetical protein
MNYSISEFLNKMREKNPTDILQEVEWEMDRVRYVSHRIKGAVAARQAGSVEYFYALERFHRFISSNSFYRGTSQHEAKLFVSVLKSLVDRGELPRSALDVERHIARLAD